MRPVDVLDLQAVADLIGVTKATAQNYRNQGRLPQPAGFVSGAPFWLRPVIEHWHKSRPGRGTRTDLKEKE